MKGCMLRNTDFPYSKKRGLSATDRAFLFCRTFALPPAEESQKRCNPQKHRNAGSKSQPEIPPGEAGYQITAETGGSSQQGIWHLR